MNNNDKYRIVTALTKDEKAALKILAVEDGRFHERLFTIFVGSRDSRLFGNAVALL